MHPIPLDVQYSISVITYICSIHQRLRILSSVRHGDHFLMDMGTYRDNNISLSFHFHLLLRSLDAFPSFHAIFFQSPYDYKVLPFFFPPFSPRIPSAEINFLCNKKNLSSHQETKRLISVVPLLFIQHLTVRTHCFCNGKSRLYLLPYSVFCISRSIEGLQGEFGDYAATSHPPAAL